MIGEAFSLSEKYGTPVFLRSTTRVSHGYASIQVKDPSEYLRTKPEGFVKDTARWVIFPRLANANHKKIESRFRRKRRLSSSPGWTRSSVWKSWTR